MLEPEALGRVGVLGLLGEGLLVVIVLVDPIAGLLLGLALGGSVLGLPGAILAQQLVGELLLVLVVLVVLLVGGGALDRPEIVVIVIVLVLVVVRVRLGLVLVVISVRSPARRVRVLAVAHPSGCRGVVGTQDRGRGQQLRRGGGRPDAAVAVPAVRCASASSAVSVPDSASTWWAESTVPSASFGSSSESSRSSPSSSEKSRRHCVEGC